MATVLNKQSRPAGAYPSVVVKPAQNPDRLASKAFQFNAVMDQIDIDDVTMAVSITLKGAYLADPNGTPVESDYITLASGQIVAGRDGVRRAPSLNYETTNVLPTHAYIELTQNKSASIGVSGAVV